MPQPWRFWITGAAAVVWTAVTQMPFDGVAWSSRSSRHSVQETARRIEQAARERGMPLFAKWTARDAGALVLVLGSGDGETPVLQPAPDAALQAPLSVWVGDTGDEAGVHVRFSDGRRLADEAELPQEVVQQVAELPQLIEAAIQS
jgi:uncharacterized protein (DUF302 family)